MRTLAIDGFRLSGPRTAMGRYIEVLLRRWAATDVPFDRIVLYCRDDPGLSDISGPTPVRIHVIGQGAAPLFWQQAVLPTHARHAAVLFCPAYTCPLLQPGRIVLANHGIYEAVPAEFSRMTRWRATPANRLSARRANRVIANSLQTRADLTQFFGVPEDEIALVYPAAAEVFFRTHSQAEIIQEVTQILKRPQPYVIFVGKLARRRNVPNLIAAFARVRALQQLPHHLLIVGPNTTALPLDDLAADAGISDAMTHVNHLEQDQLARLCAGADLFALPTTYEGISWTMFEAMASGTAVLTVAHPTLAEGPGNTVYISASPSVDDLAAGLTLLLTDAAVRAHFARSGRQRAGTFSWDTAAKATMKILDTTARRADRTTGR